MKDFPKFAIFPACSYADGENGEKRQDELNSNLIYFRSAFPTIQVIVVDNGKKSPKVPSFAKLLYSPELATQDPSVGEILLLKKGLSNINSSVSVLKMHARCKVLNINHLKMQLSKNPEFLLLNRNLFAFKNKGIDKLPYIDTRVFCLNSNSFYKLIDNAHKISSLTGCRFEHSALASVYEDKEICQHVVTSGCFYPVMEGLSGHGRDYNRVNSKLRSLVKSKLFNIGL